MGLAKATVTESEGARSSCWIKAKAKAGERGRVNRLLVALLALHSLHEAFSPVRLGLGPGQCGHQVCRYDKVGVDRLVIRVSAGIRVSIKAGLK